jgi:hypothetical protein
LILPRDGGKRIEPQLEGRNGSVWRAVTIYRRTYEDVAEEFGISKQRVGQIVADVKASIPTTDLDQMRQESLELYAELGRRALEIVDLVPAPIFVGKDGVIARDENGEPVRDYSGRLRAMETAANFDRERRKLMGLDAAQKAEVSASVKYEIVGVNTEDLS